MLLHTELVSIELGGRVNGASCLD